MTCSIDNEFINYAKSILDSWSIDKLPSDKAMKLIMNKFQELYE